MFPPQERDYLQYQRSVFPQSFLRPLQYISP